MKHLLNLFTLVACFCIASNNLNAQDDLDHVIVEARQDLITICAASAIAPDGTHIDTLGQRFHHLSDGVVYSISLSVFDYYSLEDRPGVMAIIAGSDPEGPVVHELAITIPGIDRYLPSEVISSITTASQVGAQAFTICNISDSVTFDEIKTEYAIQQYLPAGDYLIIVTTDVNDLNEYADGTTRPPYLVCHTNCPSEMTCLPGTSSPNPYQFGGLIKGGGASAGGIPLYEEPDIDMAFEVKVFQDLSTSVTSNDEELSVVIRNGCVVLDQSVSNSTITVTDVLGRTLSKTLVNGTGTIPLPYNQTVLVTIEKDGRVKTIKVIMVG